jgi:hypothetical protein
VVDLRGYRGDEATKLEITELRELTTEVYGRLAALLGET